MGHYYKWNSALLINVIAVKKILSLFTSQKKSITRFFLLYLKFASINNAEKNSFYNIASSFKS